MGYPLIFRWLCLTHKERKREIEENVFNDLSIGNHNKCMVAHSDY
jgi:hypothetical protein